MEKEQKPLLTAQDIEWRVQSVVGNTKGVWAIIIPYKSARVDVRELTKEYGDLWRNSFYRDENTKALVCKIEVYNKDIKEWVSREDVGTATATEATKGEYSDAFKRAGFKWNIGAELYNMPTVFVTLNKEEYYTQDNNGKTIYKASTKLRPNDWTWTIEWAEDTNKSKITAVDKKGNKRVNVN